MQPGIYFTISMYEFSCFYSLYLFGGTGSAAAPIKMLLTQARSQKILFGSAFEEKVELFDTAVQSRSS